MHKTIFAFTISKLALLINYFLFEKWILYADKTLSCTKIFISSSLLCLLSMAIICCILCNIRQHKVTGRFWLFFNIMCGSSLFSLFTFNVSIMLYHSLNLPCTIVEKGTPEMAVVLVALLGIFISFFEMVFLVKTLLEYKNIPIIDDNYYDP